MAQQNTNPARGMRDFLPADVRRREYVIGIIKDVYQKYGFEPLETPAVENLETLLGKYGEEGNQLIYKILKRGEHEKSGEADLALRYDLTVPLARVVANYKNELPKFFKRYQIQPVWRADRPARGRFREFYQCDVDAIGSKSMVVEAELISAVCEVLKRLGFNDFVIRLNHRKLLVEILNAAGVPENKHTDALIALDKLDKIGREGVTKEFNQRGVSPDSGEKLLIFLESIIESNISNVLDKPSTKKFIALRKQLAEKDKQISTKKTVADTAHRAAIDVASRINEKINKISEQISPESALHIEELTAQIVTGTGRIKELMGKYGNLSILLSVGEFLLNNGIENSNALSELLDILDLFGLNSDSNRIVIEPSLARGLSYYTGAIFEINVPDLAGSLGGGGRYDGLIGMFGKEEIPACGFSLGLERILVVMNERGMFQDLEERGLLKAKPADVLVTIWNEETIADSLELASDLRAQGLRVAVYPEADKLGKQFKYASSIGVSAVAILGDDERANNAVTIKYLETGEQETISRERLSTELKI